MIISILSDMDRPHPENRDIIEMAIQVMATRLIENGMPIEQVQKNIS